MEGRGPVAELQRSIICPICRAPFRDPVLLDCDHSYCRACITGQWERERSGLLSCPQCQRVFERRNLRTHVKLAVEVKIAQNLNAKTAQVALTPKSRRRRGGWIPVSVTPEGQGVEKSCKC
ncbi:RING finger protein 39 [Pelodiscus sinensis]|uniref:RING finger protein 39 n=1 Tax=Pelodiscus sinensis TaxID=13735 RepID=UPI0007041288|nr:RING finger protein 39 [Pelodiscus sinensis]|eukprot:XP_014426069.1 RING finger protein 39 [Pelodiscus sinensis]